VCRLCQPFPSNGHDPVWYRGDKVTHAAARHGTVSSDRTQEHCRQLKGIGAVLLELTLASSTLTLKTKSKRVQDVSVFTCFKKLCATSPRIDMTALSPARLREIPVAVISTTA